MKSKETLMKDFTKNLRILAIGPSGSGKTFFAHTFPKTYTINTEPGGMDTVASNPDLFRNIVGYDEFIPSGKDNVVDTLKKLKTEMVEVRQMVKDGKVETVILDNVTYLAETLWLYYSEINPTLSKGGQVDKLAGFRELDSWLYKFVVFELLTLPCHLIITCHEKLESEEAMERKVQGSSPVVANILGGFRNKIEGLMSIVMFLSKLESNGKYAYKARANKSSQKNGKSRIPLPPVIEDICYDKIMGVIKECVDKNKVNLKKEESNG